MGGGRGADRVEREEEATAEGLIRIGLGNSGAGVGMGVVDCSFLLGFTSRDWRPFRVCVLGRCGWGLKMPSEAYFRQASQICSCA